MPTLRRLFWDIETSPNVGLFFAAGYDQNINPEAIVAERKIICIGYKFAHEKVQVLRWDREQDDKAMILKFAKVAEEADELVAHYGDRFDMPWFRTRCLLHGVVIPQYKTIDTKAWASRNFYFNSNKLDYLSKVMGFGGKLKTDFGMWRDILLNKDQKQLDRMCRYCGVDVIRLEQVYNKLAVYVKPKSHEGVAQGRDKWSCPRCASKQVKKNMNRISAGGTVSHQMQCKKCGGSYSISVALHKEYQGCKKKLAAA